MTCNASDDALEVVLTSGVLPMRGPVLLDARALLQSSSTTITRSTQQADAEWQKIVGVPDNELCTYMMSC